MLFSLSRIVKEGILTMRFISVLLCMLACFVAVEARAQQCKGCNEKLTWAPPVLDNPTTITITSDPQNTFTAVLRDDEDAIIELPDNQIVETKGIHIRGGRNVQLIGGSIKATIPADLRNRAALRFSGTTESVFVEGLVIDTDSKLGLDALLVGGVLHKPGVCADIYLQNVHIKNGGFSHPTYHSDAFQYYGCTKNTRIDRMSVFANSQGLFLDPQHDTASIDMRNVDVNYIDPAHGEGYIMYLRNQPDGRRPPVKLENVYVEPRSMSYPTPREEDWERYAIHPPKHWPNGARRVGNVVTFPDYPEITGEIQLGPRPEPFVPETCVGLNYTSPGYIGVPPS